MISGVKLLDNESFCGVIIQDMSGSRDLWKILKNTKTSFQKEFIIGECAALNLEPTTCVALNFVVFLRIRIVM